MLAKETAQMSKIDRHFEKDNIKRQIKQLLIIERMVLLSIISDIVGHHLFEMLEEVSRSLEIILGFWYQIINATYDDNIYKL